MTKSLRSHRLFPVLMMASLCFGFIGTASAQNQYPLVVNGVEYDVQYCAGYYGSVGYCGMYNSYVSTSGSHTVGSMLQLLVLPENPEMDDGTNFNIYLTQVTNGKLIAGSGCAAVYLEPYWMCTITLTEAGSFYVVAHASNPAYANRPTVQGITITD
jgi:hypothetical protein